MKTAACIFAAAMFTVPVYAQSSSALCGLDMYETRVPADFGPIALDSDGDMAASLLYSGFGAHLRLWDMTDSDAPVIDSTTQVLFPFSANAHYASVSISGTVVAIGNSEVMAKGFSLVDISNPESPVIRATDDSLVVNAVKVVGDRLYVLTSSELIVYDISDLDAPAQLGTLAGSFTKALDVVGDRMYLGNQSAQLQIFDVSNPASIAHLGDFAATGNFGVVDVQGDLAAIGGADSLITLDVSDPSTPVMVSTQASDRPILRIVIDGDWMYSTTDHWASIYDMTVPSSPVAMNKIGGPDIQEFPQIAVHDGSLWVRGAREMIQVDAAKAVPTSPEIFDGIVPGALKGAKFGYMDVHQGSIFAIDTVNNALHVIDATPGSTHSVISTLSFGGPVVADIGFDGDTAFVLSGSGEVSVIDISDLSSPALLGAWDATGPSTAWGANLAIEVEGSVLYTCPTNDYITIFDISDPMSPVFLSEYPVPELNDTTEFDVQDGRVAFYASYYHGGAEWGGVTTLDCTDPSSPVLLSTKFHSNVRAMKLVGDQVVSVIDDNSINDIYGIFQSSSILSDSSSSIDFSITIADSGTGGVLSHDIVLKDGFAIVPGSYLGTSALTLFDISDPGMPRVAGSIAVPSGVGGASIASVGDRLYSVGGFDATLGIYDISSCGVACIADFTGDGELDFFDVSDFLDAFGAQDPVADLNNDGEYDFFDVSDFLDAFGAGCP
tara:strand:+ start:160398 stop:162563 length:2166 start_codon:yes stop_codon:yes gene_type:complete